MDSENFHLSRGKIFLYSCVSFIVGIALARFIPESIIKIPLLWFSLSAGSVVVMVIFWKQPTGRFVLMLFVLMLFGLWRFSVSIPANTADKIWYYNGRSVEVKAIIISEPDIREANTKLKVLKQEVAKLKGKYW